MKPLLSLVLVAACLAAALPVRAEPAAESTPPPPNCSHCREKLQTVDALRQALPAEWTLQLENEPVFGGEMLVVEAGRHNAKTLVLVHGLGQNGFTDWISVMPQLARRYHVITFDFPGFGYSGSPSGKYSPRNYALVLSGVLSRHAKDRAIVVGHSLGGAVALRFARDFPGQLAKLVLVDAAGILHRTAFVKHSARLPLEVEQVPGFLKETVARLKDFGSAAVERIAGWPDPTRLLAASDLVWAGVLANRTNANAALALVEEDFSAVIPAVQTPTWILWGDADPIAPLRTGQLLSYRLPQAQLLVMPGVGHTPMAPATAALFYPQLERALNETPQPAPSLAATADSPGTPADLRCTGETDRLYSGHYREVIIEDCRAVTLQNFSAERLVIIDSVVQALNIHLRNPGTALEIVNSTLIATAGEISGEVAIWADNARLDLAGIRLDARRTVLEVRGLSRLIGSCLEIRSPTYNGTWQGSQQLEAGTLAL
jgi:pimeloyl-ACP methyl ester carboxylesterase